MTRWRAAVAAGALAVALAGCSVEVVDAEQDPSPARDEPPRDAPAVPRGPDAEPPALPGRTDLHALTTGQTACGDGELTVGRAGAGVEVTDTCAVLTVAGAEAVVVADDVGMLVVTGAGARVAVRSIGSLTIAAADVTVTWEEGAPVVDGDTPGSSYGLVDPG